MDTYFCWSPIHYQNRLQAKQSSNSKIKNQYQKVKSNSQHGYGLIEFLIPLTLLISLLHFNSQAFSKYKKNLQKENQNFKNKWHQLQRKYGN